jgi:hypothetical protein
MELSAELIVVSEVSMTIFAICLEVLMSDWCLEIKVPYVELKFKKESSKMNEFLKKLIEAIKTL